ncbi:hypothetical protein OG709_34400 [Streptomyces sp. NBC_01267]|nr:MULTISPECIES: hypothetical protein [unclassified Streptomyces]WSC18241.1 hypothetical protein OIE60_00505 [Streptomyces sp. NBC_01766]
MTPAMTQYFRTPDDVRLAYLDLGGAGRPVLALRCRPWSEFRRVVASG